MNRHDHHRVAELCFHGIGEPGRPLEDGEERFWIQPETFRAIIDVVTDFPHVELSFDDSNTSDVIHALPVLVERGLSATFYVIAGRLDQAGSLSSEGVRRLFGEGMKVGSHGMDHVSWQQVRDGVTRHREFVVAREMLSELIRDDVTSAACPRGSYDRGTIRTLKGLGYSSVRIIDGGASRPGAWLRDRYSVTRFDSAESIAEYLERPDGRSTEWMRRRVKGYVKRWR